MTTTRGVEGGARVLTCGASGLPIAYYSVAHAGLAAALAVLVVDPSVPGGSFYHARFVALVHALTIAWLTGSILGSLYIVGPLALHVPMPVRRADWIAFAGFLCGSAGMIAHFWINTYDGMAWSAMIVVAGVLWVTGRIVRGLRRSKVAWGVRLHVVLAILNFVAAATVGMLIGFDRSRGFLASPLATMFAHAHLAAVGWVLMLVVGLSYRLIPMILPAAMPSGSSIAISAILLQSGVVVLATALSTNATTVWPGAFLSIAGLAAFVAHVRWMVSRRLPRPPALPSRDWSAWQIHGAFLWLVVAVGMGAALALGVADEYRLPLMWVYGIAGLMGFLAQMVVGMQGRLVPLYAWYRAYAALGEPPSTPANALPSPTFARPIFIAWACGLPMLAWGLVQADQPTIRTGAALLLIALVVGATYIVFMVRRAINPLRFEPS